jgi:hypothetical protein
VRDALLPDGIGERLRDVFLPDHVGKPLRAVFSGYDLIGHSIADCGLLIADLSHVLAA